MIQPLLFPVTGRFLVPAMLAAASLLSAAGCQSLRTAGAADPSPLGATPELPAATMKETASRGSNRVISFLTGKEPQDKQRAKQLYQEGDALFHQATDLPRAEAIPLYKQAAKQFRRAAEAHPDSALEQDALLMAGESLFFADRLTEAEEAFAELQKKYPRNRHNDRVAARLFEISRYWIETEKAGNASWMPVNFFDPKRPMYDVDGHAIRVLDNIRYNDPTGMLSDDATMAAGVEFMEQGKYDRADEFFTDLRDSFPDSEHQFNGHLLGLRCKLLIYAGPQYSGLVLDEAATLIEQTRRRFPGRLQDDPQVREEMARIAAEIDFKKAQRLVERARYREKRGEYGAARYYYQAILEEHGATPFAEESRERLAAIESEPDVRPQRMAWLVDAFPNQQRSKPLVVSEGGTLLR